MSDASPSQQLWYGLLLLAIGAGLGLVARSPGWSVPPSVAFVVAGTFACAGVSLLLQRAGHPRAATMAVALFAAGLAVVGAWIGFGPGERSCTANGMGLGGTPCRAVFGGGAIVTACFAVLVLRSLSTRGK